MESVNSGTLKTIGTNLKTLRETTGLSRKEVAAALGVSYQQVQKYEQGTNRFPLENLPVLQRLYRIPYERFFEKIVPARSAETFSPAEFSEDSRLFLKFRDMQNRPLKKKIREILRILLD